VTTREAACHCGQLHLTVEGEPFATSICHCLACQRRTGSAFGMQAAFRPAQVTVNGRFNDYSRISDESDRKEHVFHFCPECGSQVFYTEPDDRDLIVISTGAFADSSFPPPTESGYDWRRHPWVGLPDWVQSYPRELWDPARSLYEASDYTRAAEVGRSLIDQHPDVAFLYFNVACCESLAGQTDASLEHLQQATEMWDGFREMAGTDGDFDAIRGESRFQQLISG
jgi:hypothetical protein